MIKNSFKKILFAVLIICYTGTSFIAFGFGKNKVQYENLKWQYNKTPHFHSYFHQNQGILPKITAQWIENAYYSLYKDFGYKHRKSIPLIVYGSPTLFEQTNVTPGIIPEGVGGFTESLKNRIVVPFTGSYEDYRHVLHHELVHAFQFGILLDQFGSAFFRAGAIQMPLWFAEGSAEFLSSGWDCAADMFMMDKTINSSVPLPGPEMMDYIVYKGGQSFLFFLSSSRGDSTFHRFLAAFRKSKQVTNSMERIYKKSLEDLGKEWHRELKRIYWPEIGKRENLDKKATPLTSHTKSRSHLNLKPRVSPDGSMVAYYSDAKDYTKIFIADTEGKVHTKIGQFGYGGYFESFQPFRSGMCWSPNSDRLAFITKNKGKNEIRIIDVKKKQLILTLSPDFASISQPDWSPNGKSIVFSGMRQYSSNLHIIDIESTKLTQLTNDIRYEFDPRFSRDGTSIIFAALDTCGIADRNRLKERPTSDLYIMELKDKSVTKFTASPWNEKQPCFSPDGNSIAYISDRNGINNIYIAPLESPDSARALTDIIGGCSDPDWSLEDNALVFSLFQKQGWDIWLIDEPKKNLLDSMPSPTLWVKSNLDSTVDFFLPAPILSDTTDTASISEISLSDTARPLLTVRNKKHNSKEKIGVIEEEPPIQNDSVSLDTTTTLSEDTAEIFEDKSLTQQDSIATAPSESTEVAHTIESDTTSDSLTPADTSLQQITALSDTTADTVSHHAKKDSGYTAPILPEKLVDYPYRLKLSIDMVSVGMAYSTFYGYAGQGVIVLSDLLGNHQIALAGNIQGSFEENNIFAFYINSKYRLDFGIGGFYDRYYMFASLDYYNLYHDTNIGGTLLLRYPFSLFSRIDFSLFYQHMKREPYIYKDGKLKSNVSDSLPILDLNITMPSISYTFDNILWGITGPVNGFRATASALWAPPFKAEDASFVSLDFDIRNYWHIRRKFVWANRFTFGFSEPINRDESDRRYFLGGNENWIFYEINRRMYEKSLYNTIYSSVIVPFRGWSYYDITGTRYTVFNTEFRFPFVRAIDLVWPLPIQIRYINGAFFVDIGNAWDPQDQYALIPLPQRIYGGFGFGFRANLGIFILRYDLAWGTDWRKHVYNPKNYFSLGAEF